MLKVEFTVPTSAREQMVDVTRLIIEAIEKSGVSNGVAFCHVPHTTAGITINENADPDVTRDLLYKLGKEIPQNDGYHHAEGNSDAHLKSSLMGCTQQILVEDGRPLLGQWQAVFFCEFDGPRRRRLIVTVGKLA